MKPSVDDMSRKAARYRPNTTQEVHAEENGAITGKIEDRDCTINAAAGLVWWYPDALYNVIGSMTTKINANRTAYSLVLPTTGTFDIDRALQSAGASMSFGARWDSMHNTTEYFGTMITLLPPEAALTMFTSVTSVLPIPSTTFESRPKGGWFTEAPNPTYLVPGILPSFTEYV